MRFPCLCSVQTKKNITQKGTRIIQTLVSISFFLRRTMETKHKGHKHKRKCKKWEAQEGSDPFLLPFSSFFNNHLHHAGAVVLACSHDHRKESSKSQYPAVIVAVTSQQEEEEERPPKSKGPRQLRFLGKISYIKHCVLSQSR